MKNNWGCLMKQYIFITNGTARSGKDTFARLVGELTPVQKVSSIDRVKEIAKSCGWDGKKTEEGRKFLSDLKMLLTDYNDLPFKEIKKAVNEFRNNPIYKILFIDIREPDEIEKAKNAFGAETILVIRKGVDQIASNYGDASVNNYLYDYYIHNDGSIDDLRKEAEKFMKGLYMSKREQSGGE